MNPQLPATLAGIAALWLWQTAASQLSSHWLGLPEGPVAGFLALSGVLLVLDATPAGRPFAQRALTALRPAEALLLRELPLLFSPALVAVLLRPLPPPRQLAVLLVLLVGLAILTVVGGGLLLRPMVRRSGPLTLPPEPTASAYPPWSLGRQARLLLLAGILAALHRAVPALQGAPLAFAVGLLGTLAGWQLGRAMPQQVQRWLPPLVVVSVVGAGLLVLAGIDASAYLSRQPVGGGGALLWLLGPAVQALALGLVRRFAVVRQRAMVVAVPVVLLAATSLVLSSRLAAAVGLPREWGLPIALRSVTSAVGLSLAHVIEVDPARTAACIVVTGVLVAQVGPWLLTRLGCRDPVARGVVLGIAGHGLAAAALLRREPLAGVVASLVFGLMAVATALWLVPLRPWLWP